MLNIVAKATERRTELCETNPKWQLKKAGESNQTPPHLPIWCQNEVFLIQSTSWAFLEKTIDNTITKSWEGTTNGWQNKLLNSGDDQLFEDKCRVMKVDLVFQLLAKGDVWQSRLPNRVQQMKILK